MKNNKMLNYLYKISAYTVIIIFSFISVYLFLLSLFSTAYISSEINQFHEYTYFVKDAPFLIFGTIILLSVIIALISVVCEKKRYSCIVTKKGKVIIPSFLFLLLNVWVFITQMMPGSDQYYIFDCAARLAENDYSIFEAGGYLERYPFQTFLVLIVYCFQFIFGKHHYLAFQCMNVLFLSGIFMLFKKISEEIHSNKINGDITYITIALFFPLSLYVGFCYGSIPGLFFSALGILCGVKYLNTFENKYAFLSASILAICPYIKNSCLVFFIAYILILFVSFLKTKRWKNYGVIAVMLGIYVFIDIIIKIIVFLWTGYTLSKGYPLIGQIAMGLQGNDILADGWFNSFTVNVYEQVNYDYNMAQEIYIRELKYRIADFWMNKGTALRFFSEKIASQWNNPTFQGFWYYKVRDSLIQRAPLVEFLLYGDGTRILCSIANWLQSFFLFSNLSYIYHRWKKFNVQELFIQVCVIGGFLLHILVEAKSQYVLIFYVLLIPFVAQGLIEFVKDIKNIIMDKRKSFKVLFLIGVILILLVIIQFTPGKFFDIVFRMEKDAFILQTEQWM